MEQTTSPQEESLMRNVPYHAPIGLEESNSKDRKPGQSLTTLEKARDCETLPTWLSWASHSTDPDLLREVARNPNTPMEDLLRLWGMFPDEVIHNPVVTLWEFTGSKSVSHKIPKDLLFKIYQAFLSKSVTQIPETLISSDWRIYFIKNLNGSWHIPPHYFVRDINPKVRLVLVEKVLPQYFEKNGAARFPLDAVQSLLSNASPDLVKAFVLAVAERWLVLEEENPAFWEKAAREFYSLDGEGIREHLSRWDFLSTDVIEAIADRATPAIQANLALLRGCPDALHERWAGDENPEVRAAVARSTSIKALHAQFLEDSHHEVRAALAQSPHIGEDIQQAISSPKHADIHHSFLKNPHILLEILLDMAQVSNGDIKGHVLVHPNLPQEVFDRLMATTKVRELTCLAKKPELHTPELYKSYKKRLGVNILLSYATSPHTPAEILAELACHSNAKIQVAIDNLVDCKPRTIPDSDAMAIIEAVINHPHTPEERSTFQSKRMSTSQALRVFKMDQCKAEIRYAVMLNRFEILRNAGLYSEYAALYRQTAADLESLLPQIPLHKVRPLVAKTETPPAIREILRVNPSNDLRASNMVQSRTISLGAIIDAFPEAFPDKGDICLQATPQEILKKLATSPHSLLAAYAQRCLAESSDKWAKKVGLYPSGTES
jgi:hypothetical protein